MEFVWKLYPVKWLDASTLVQYIIAYIPEFFTIMVRDSGAGLDPNIAIFQDSVIYVASSSMRGWKRNRSRKSRKTWAYQLGFQFPSWEPQKVITISEKLPSENYEFGSLCRYELPMLGYIFNQSSSWESKRATKKCHTYPRKIRPFFRDKKTTMTSRLLLLLDW